MTILFLEIRFFHLDPVTWDPINTIIFRDPRLVVAALTTTSDTQRGVTTELFKYAAASLTNLVLIVMVKGMYSGTHRVD